MPLTITAQFNMIFFSLLSGIIIGILFDVYRIVRGICKIQIVIVIEDILFWILTAMVVFTFLLYTNYAFLTMYVYMLIICGAAFYIAFISRQFYHIEKRLVIGISKFFRIINKRILYVLRLITYMLLDKDN